MLAVLRTVPFASLQVVIERIVDIVYKMISTLQRLEGEAKKDDKSIMEAKPSYPCSSSLEKKVEVSHMRTCM